jgi:hypothetical protein
MSEVSVKLQDIELSKITFDKTNPNRMNEKQLKGLEQSIKDHGFLQPIILNKKFVTVDGEHRTKAMRNLGYVTIPAIVVDKEEVDQKLVRQIMNKLSGSHDYEKDAQEFKIFLDNDRIKDMSKYLNQHQDDFLKVIDQSLVNRAQDKEMLEHYHDTFLFGNIKQIVLYFQNEAYEKIMPRLQTAMKELEIDNHTDLFEELLNRYENNRS